MTMISIIIPVFNEEARIPHIEAQLRQLNGVYGSDYEVIFVDGGSDDKTVPSLSYPCIPSQSGRGIQLCAGAHAAQGNILWFVHADSTLDPESLAAIQTHINTGHQLGCFTLKFDHPHPALKLIALGSNIRVTMRKLIFGDQGMFITRDLYDQLEGFDHVTLMEDYLFSLKAQRAQIPFTRLASVITTSSRRFFSSSGRLTWKSVIQTLIVMQRAQARLRSGVSCGEIARFYRSHMNRKGR